MSFKKWTVSKLGLLDMAIHSQMEKKVSIMRQNY